MKNIKHLRPFFLLLLSIAGIVSTLPAQTNSFQVFLQKALQYQPYYLQKDTVMQMPFIGQQSEMSWYYEVQFEGDEATFLEEVYYGFNQRGSQMICRCETEQALKQLEQQVAAWQKSSVRINIGSANFQQQYCLTRKVDQPFPKTTGKIQKVLMETGSMPTVSHEGLTLNGRWLKAEDGHWVLDLSGRLPDGYIFLSFGEEHALHYIKGEETLLYPPEYAPSWKRSLIKSGRFGKNILNSPDNNVLSRKNHFRPFPYASGGQEWNLLFHWHDTLALEAQPREAAGVIYLSALSEEKEEQSGPLKMLKPGKKWDVSCDGKVIVIQNISAPNQGVFRLGEGMRWDEVVIKDPEGSIVATYNWGEPEPSLQILPKAGSFYSMTMSKRKPVPMVVPFQGNFPVEKVRYAKGRSGEPAFQFFRRGQNGITAEYELELPLNTSLQGFEISGVVDDQGNDYGIAASPDKKWVKIEYERYVKDVNQYEIQTGPFELPPAEASQIIMSGTYSLSTNGEKAKTYQWIDTLHLAKAAIEMPKPQAPPLFSEDAFKAENISLFPPAGKLMRQGLYASIPFRIPEGQGAYYGLNAEGSELLQLTDDLGHDLIAAHRSAFEDRLDAAKVSATRSSGENELNKENIIMQDWDQPGPKKKPILNIHTYASAGKGAGKIMGSAKVAYYTYNEEQPIRTTHQLNLSMQPSLAITVADQTTFQFKHASFGVDAKDGSKFIKYNFKFSTANPKFHLAKVVVKDQAGNIVSLQGNDAYTSSFKPYNLTIPEGKWGEYTIELIYHELKEYTVDVPFIISLGEYR